MLYSGPAFSAEVLGDGIVELKFDLADESVNKLNRVALDDLAAVGAAFFTMVVIFQLVNLPVEFNASRQARQTLVANGLVSAVEDREIARVLNAAAMTYVAATISAILTLLYLLMRSGLLGGASRD